ncbi:hypothetical protein I3843_09G037100 [Carya illinoinensis]|uniref:Uncharacterized protein n=1 Tax=Carya illinoinensis TaxID=32201 RepID=A0A8T1PII6_CARIL|nr:hypothetical protein I3760_09G036300 [Carya illinoinensis]KAG6640912.1 hypothetical protein CIPAW_09G036900 [Carya illinoinensis]KAG7961839.1 hypothetical protein I3843_09G037100 [Carya illinoinensis]
MKDMDSTFYRCSQTFKLRSQRCTAEINILLYEAVNNIYSVNALLLCAQTIKGGLI